MVVLQIKFETNKNQGEVTDLNVEPRDNLLNVFLSRRMRNIILCSGM